MSAKGSPQRKPAPRSRVPWQDLAARWLTVLGILSGLGLGGYGLAHHNSTLETFAGNLFIGVPLLAAQLKINRRRRDEDDEDPPK
jgi:hypothetical protein